MLRHVAPIVFLVAGILVSAPPAAEEIEVGPAREAVYAEVRELGLDPEAITAPLRLTPEMRRWLEEAVPRHPENGPQMQLLLRALLGQEGLGLTYEVGFTGTAEEVFETRVANCLGFTQLFVAMGRQLGVPVYYLGVDRLTNFKRESDLIIVSDHVTAAIDDGFNRRVLEFSLAPDFDYRTARRVEDLEALALYYSNRGAELVQERRYEAALEQLEISVTLAPRLAQAWVNLGVAQRRLGRLRDAEASYRHAIDLEPDHLSAFHNLVGLYRLQGLDDPAGEILRMLDRRDNRNPFVYLQLGDLTAQRGSLEEAGRFYRRAVKLGREHAETHAAYGLWLLQTGRRSAAVRRLAKAEKRDPEEARTRLLRRTLAEGG